MHENAHPMPTIKERLKNWKEKRSTWQKATDILFWLLLILLIIPGPRKVIATGVNKAFLLVKTPDIMSEENQEVLSGLDYGWILAWDQDEPFYFSNVQNEVVFLNFWATWCPPCVAELPEIKKLYEKWGDKVVFMLATNESPEVVKAFMDKHGYVLYWHPATRETGTQFISHHLHHLPRWQGGQQEKGGGQLGLQGHRKNLRGASQVVFR